MSTQSATRFEIEEQRQRDIRAASLGLASSASIDLSVLSTIFILLSRQLLAIAFEQLLKYILLPVAAVSNILQAVFAWRTTYLNKFEGNSLAKAIIETIGATLITAAVIGSLVASAAFTIAGPALFISAFTVKTLYNFGNAIYNGIKAARETNLEKKVALRANVIESTIGGVVGIVATIAVAGVMLLGKTAMTIAGIISGVAGATLAIKKCFELANQDPRVEAAKALQREDTEDNSDFTSTARLHNHFGISRSSSNDSLLGSEVYTQETDEKLESVVVHQQPANDYEIIESESPRMGING